MPFFLPLEAALNYFNSSGDFLSLGESSMHSAILNFFCSAQTLPTSSALAIKSLACFNRWGKSFEACYNASFTEFIFFIPEATVETFFAQAAVAFPNYRGFMPATSSFRLSPIDGALSAISWNYSKISLNFSGHSSTVFK